MSAIHIQVAASAPGPEVAVASDHRAHPSLADGNPAAFASALAGQTQTSATHLCEHPNPTFTGAHTTRKKGAHTHHGDHSEPPSIPVSTPGVQTPVVPTTVPITVSPDEEKSVKSDAANANALMASTGTEPASLSAKINTSNGESGLNIANAIAQTTVTLATQRTAVAANVSSVPTTDVSPHIDTQSAGGGTSHTTATNAQTTSLFQSLTNVAPSPRATPKQASSAQTIASALTVKTPNSQAQTPPTIATTTQNAQTADLPTTSAQAVTVTHVEASSGLLAATADAHVSNAQTQSATPKTAGAVTAAATAPSSTPSANRAIEGASAGGNPASASQSKSGRSQSHGDSSNANSQDSSGLDKAANVVATGQASAQNGNAQTPPAISLKAGDTISVGELVDRQSNVAPTVNTLTQPDSIVHADVIHPELGRISVETQMHQGQINVVLSSDLRQTVHRLVEETPRLSNELSAANTSLGTITVKESQAGTSSHFQQNQQRESEFAANSDTASHFGGSSSSARQDHADGSSELSDTESASQPTITAQKATDRSRVRIVL